MNSKKVGVTKENYSYSESYFTHSFFPRIMYWLSLQVWSIFFICHLMEDAPH